MSAAPTVITLTIHWGKDTSVPERAQLVDAVEDLLDLDSLLRDHRGVHSLTFSPELDVEAVPT